MTAGRRAGFLLLLTLFPAGPLPAEGEDPIVLTEREKAWLEEGHRVKVRVSDWPPYQFCKGEFKGISVDYITKIFARHNIAYEFVSGEDIPWPEALEMI